jgi:mevalonate kinase
MQTYYAHGKLLLSGEYAILDGAKGLALPTKFGQRLKITPGLDSHIHWKALTNENTVWFESVLSDSFELISSSNRQEADMLIKILSAVKALNPECNLSGISVETRLEFPNDWGLGSSSTLISLVSQYFNCDPYQLLAATFGGSGYDIACATASGPITYQLFPPLGAGGGGRQIQSVKFNPVFKDQLYFLHLGKKQNSREGIKHYRNSALDKAELAGQITDITNKLLQASELDEFSYYLDLHEVLISNALNLQKVKETSFPDFPGSIKSLGAWGGDFVCVASDEDENRIRRYFIDKGYSTLLKYSEVILP